MRTPLLLTLALLASPRVIAQQGDNKDHGNMDAVVPEKLIPEAPVLPVDKALKTFKLAPGFTIEPVAAEPLIEKPVALDFDAAGRMWVCEMRGYMPDIDGKGESDPQGRIVVLEDKNGDGKAETRTVFLDKILLPRAIHVREDGILFLDEHRLLWVKRNGLSPAGEPVVIDPKFNTGGNVEHKPNGLLSNLDNWLYLAKSDKRLRLVDGQWKIDRTDFRGQWGIARDDWGRLYHNHNSAFLFGETLAPNLLLDHPTVRMKYRDINGLGSNRTWPIRVTPAVNRAYISKKNGYNENTLDPSTFKLVNCTAAAGMTIYRGTNFPKDWKGSGFVTESVANLVKAIRITEDSSGKQSGTHPLGEKEFLASTDERFRPVNVYTAPDGSLYLLDMYHGIIQHKTYMTSYLREQTLSRKLDGPGFGHGRIYRIRSNAGKLEPKADLSSLKGLDLVRMLMHANSWHRETAQRLLVERNQPDTVPLVAKLAAKGAPVAQVHAIWTLEGMGALKAEHLVEALKSGEPKVQVSALWAATRLDAGELAKLEPLVLSADAKDHPELLPYKARVLAAMGTPKALDALAALLKDSPKSPFIRPAILSGIHPHEKDFLAKVDPKEGDFVRELEKGSQNAAATASGPKLKGDALASFERGKKIYHGEAACFGCHGPTGDGIESLGPPLAGSEWVTGAPETFIRIVLHGMTGPVTVAGTQYAPTADMPGLGPNPAFTDQMLADVITYVRNEWDNQAAPVTAAQVAKERAATKDRVGRPWTEKELKR